MISLNGKTAEELVFNKDIGSAYLGSKLVFLRNITIHTTMPLILWDKHNGMFVTTNKLQKDQLTRYKPIGLIVIPAEHDVWGTGECGIISLVNGSLIDPNNGTTEYERIAVISVDGTRSDPDPIPELANIRYTNVPICTYESTLDNLQLLEERDSYNKSVGLYLPHQIPRYYYAYPNGYSIKQIKWSWVPGPYNADGTRNALYFQSTEPCTQQNCLSDFDGFGNTELLSKSLSDDQKHLISACISFYTPGTRAGDWYLPAMGELGYMYAAWDAIDADIRQLQRLGIRSTPLVNTTKYVDYAASTLSSTFTGGGNRYVSYEIEFRGNGNFCIRAGYVQDLCLVRPFYRMLPPKSINE